MVMVENIKFTHRLMMMKTNITMRQMYPILRTATPLTEIRSNLSRLISRKLLMSTRLNGRKELLASEQTLYLRKNKLINNLQQLHKTLKMP